MGIDFIDFAETRELLRNRVFGATGGMPLWPAEAVISAEIETVLDVLCVPDCLTIPEYERDVYVIKQAEIKELPEFPTARGSFLDDSRNLVLPPIVEMFGDMPVLVLGYSAAFYWIESNPDFKTKPFPCIQVKRVLMKQTPLSVVEKPLPHHLNSYLALSDWEERPRGQRRHFILDDQKAGIS